MPYLAQFGLRDYPFTLTPNVDYYYPTQENANIIASLDFALRRESGIVKVVGEVGTGKTLLCRLLITKLEETDVAVAYINAPQADATSIVRAVCEEFGIAVGGDAAPYAALNRFLIEQHGQGRRAVVVVDEAQHLGRDGLEAIRLVSNLETERSKLLQIVLFGQTELDELLGDPSLRQLRQRIAFSFTTKPLTEGEAKRYVAHRLKVSRRDGVDYEIFNAAALAVVVAKSGGIPRVVNILADKSLLVAYSEGSPTVQKKHALAAVKESPGLVARRGMSGIGPFLRGAAVAAILIGLAAGGWLAWHGWQAWQTPQPPTEVHAAANPHPQDTAPAAPSTPAPAAPSPAAPAAATPPLAATAASPAAEPAASQPTVSQPLADPPPAAPADAAPAAPHDEPQAAAPPPADAQQPAPAAEPAR